MARLADRALARLAATSTLHVQALIDDGCVNDAWALAQKGGVEEPTMVELAALREKGHPSDAVPILQREVQRELTSDERGRYERAAGLIARIQDCMRRATPPLDFPAYVRELWPAIERSRA